MGQKTRDCKPEAEALQVLSTPFQGVCLFYLTFKKIRLMYVLSFYNQLVTYCCQSYLLKILSAVIDLLIPYIYLHRLYNTIR